MGNIILQQTTLGKALMAKIKEGNGDIPLKITRIVSGAGFSEDPLSLTDLSDPKLEYIVTGSYTTGDRTTFSTYITNAGVPALDIPPLEVGYSLSQVGFYAIDPDVGEILYLISQYEPSRPIPSVHEIPITYKTSFNIITGNATNVIIEITPIEYDEILSDIEILKAQIKALLGFNIFGVAQTYAGLPSPGGFGVGAQYLVMNDETHDGKTTVYEVVMQGGVKVWSYVSTLDGMSGFGGSGVIVSPTEPEPAQADGGVWFDTSGGPWEGGGGGETIVIAGNVYVGEDEPEDTEMVWYQTEEP